MHIILNVGKVKGGKGEQKKEISHIKIEKTLRDILILNILLISYFF